jgi:hypothetical protein
VELHCTIVQLTCTMILASSHATPSLFVFFFSIIPQTRYLDVLLHYADDTHVEYMGFVPSCFLKCGFIIVQVLLCYHCWCRLVV